MDSKIYSVDSVCFSLTEDEARKSIVVAANGMVTTSGWRNPRLVPYVYVTPPQDGIQDFDFFAESPTGIVLQALQPISGVGFVVSEDWMKGIRVHAVNGNAVVMLDDKSCETGNTIIDTVPDYFPL